MREFEKETHKKTLVEEIPTPSMSFRQICERFIYRKPTFLNVDIQGNEALALLKNDWSNPMCRPELLYIEKTALNDYVDMPTASEILANNSYTYVGKFDRN